MFLHLSVILSTGGEGSASHNTLGRQIPSGRHNPPLQLIIQSTREYGQYAVGIVLE